MSERSIFMEALEFDDPREREAHVLRACGNDERLRARVEALLHRHQSDNELALDRMPDFDLSVTADLPSASEHPGTVIGPYKLLEQIGEGGMGTVFMAEQVQPIRRKVALKIIKPGMDTKQVIARFEAERQALALMDHPNIARVLDAGATDSGRPYFVMELVRGIPITDYCDREKLSIADRLGLFVLVCQAVQHAHQKGVIHRDLKPSNVLITLHDGVPVPKVIDFGIAKATGQQLTEKTLFTGFAQLVGTPLYMSPEQAELSGLDIDTRSDIYSLGVLLYELLTGTTPFDRETFRKAAFDEIRRIIREQEPPKPSMRLSALGATLTAVSGNRGSDPRKLTRSLRGELDWVVMKCLEKDRTRRYETASGLAADVRRYLDDEPVAACPPSAWYRLGKLTRRHRAALMTAALVVAALAVGTAASTWQAIRATRAERGTATALAEAQRRATESQAVVDFLIKDLIAAAAPGQNQGPKTPVEAVLARADTRVEGRFADQPLVEAAIRDALGRSYVELERYDKVEQHLNRAIALRRDHLGPEHPDTLASQFALTQMLHVRDSSNVELQKEAAVLCQQVVDARRRVLGPDHPDTVAAREHLAFVLRVAGQPDEALSLFRQTYDAMCRLWGAEDPRTLISLQGQAMAHFDLGHREEAIDLYRRVLALRLRVQAPDDPLVLWALTDLMCSLNEVGRFEEAAQLRGQVLEQHERVYGLCDSHTGSLFSMLYRTLKGSGRWDDIRVNSERWLAKVLRLTPDQEGRSSDPEWRRHRAERLTELVWQLVTLPDLSRIDTRACVRAAEEAHAVSPDATYADGFARYPSARTALGLAYYRAGAWDKAIATLDQAIATRGGDDGFDWLILAMAHARRAHRGDLPQARTWFDKAAQWREEHPERNEWLQGLRAEAAKLLGLPEPASPTEKNVRPLSNG
jgi:serine/threonine protein kinase/tetratricopeptide (TPR) repeat protein